MQRTLTVVVCGLSVLATSALTGCDRDDDVGDAFTPAPPIGATDDQPAAAPPRPQNQDDPTVAPGHAADDPYADSGPTGPSDDPTVASFLGLEAPKPADWSWKPPANEMVHTNYAVPGADGGDEATITVFFFGPGMGGPVQNNIDRWQMQFQGDDGRPPEPDVTGFEANGMEITLVELAGAYQAMGQPTHKQDQLFLSAIVEAPIGRIFIRFVGDEQTVEHHRDAFMSMLENLEPIEDGDEASGDPGAPYAR